MTLGAYAHGFAEAVRVIENHRSLLNRSTSYWQGKLPEDLSRRISDLERLVRELDLSVVIKQIGRVRMAVHDTLAIPDSANMQITHDYVGELLSRVADELEGHRFLYVPPRRAERYQQPTLFGAEVNAKFPEMISDIEEAGSCFAVSRYTASVFHLMRVMERGIRRIAQELNAMIDTNRAWEAISKDVKTAINSLPSSNQAEKDRKEAFIGAHARLDSVRTVWRNNVMHPKDSYSEDEAEDVFTNVRSFIRHLAGIV